MPFTALRSSWQGEVKYYHWPHVAFDDAEGDSNTEIRNQIYDQLSLYIWTLMQVAAGTYLHLSRSWDLTWTKNIHWPLTFIYSPYIQQRTVLAKHRQLVVRNCRTLSVSTSKRLQLVSLGAPPKAISHDGKFLQLREFLCNQLARCNAKSLRNPVLFHVRARADRGAADEHRLRRLRGQREEGPYEGSR
jgi:hypothetical protein